MKNDDKKNYRYLDAISSSDYTQVHYFIWQLYIRCLSAHCVVLTRLSQRTAQTSGGVAPESDKPQLSDNIRARAGELQLGYCKTSREGRIQVDIRRVCCDSTYAARLPSPIQHRHSELSFCSAHHQFSVRLITKFRSEVTTAPWHTIHVTRATCSTETFLSPTAILRHCATN